MRRSGRRELCTLSSDQLLVFFYCRQSGCYTRPASVLLNCTNQEDFRLWWGDPATNVSNTLDGRHDRHVSETQFVSSIIRSNYTPLCSAGRRVDVLERWPNATHVAFLTLTLTQTTDVVWVTPALRPITSDASISPFQFR